MYLLSWMENDNVLEASLGGRVTYEEMAVFFEEISEIVDEIGEEPYLLVLDYSRTKPFDMKTDGLLCDLKEFCLENGAERVITVVRDESEVPHQTTAYLQRVLEGTVEFVTEAQSIRCELTPIAQLRAA